MTKQQLISCQISPRESQSFARASGDFNPLHLDPVMARRYQFGSTLIHGINGTLRALDAFFATRPPHALASLQVTFSKPVRQGDELSISFTPVSPSTFRIEVHTGDGQRATKVQSIEFALADAGRDGPSSLAILPQAAAGSATPDDLSLEQAEKLQGDTPLTWAPELFQTLFPHLAEKLPATQCATILATTKIVGMICPGLNSVYARLKLQFAGEGAEPPSHLHYRVESVDPRFSRVLLAVSNAAAAGTIEAFFRPAPVAQASAAQISSLVARDRFAEQQALVVGGSRGLGEVTAKLLCAGGASAMITYASGREDAIKVAADISANRGTCDTMCLDVLNNEAPAGLFAGPGKLTHIYYMASPLIEKSGSQLWDAKLFARYTDFYILGLARLLALFAANPQYREAELTVYQPSTVFLDVPEKGFTEYTACKAAAESFAKQMQLKYPRWRFLTPRLPRMLTDQTSGLADLDILDSARHLLASLQAD